MAYVMRPRYDRAVHSVAILPETPLTAFLDRAELGVNSYHHQAIKALAPPALWRWLAVRMDWWRRCTCRKPFVWAVRWYPEFSFRTGANSQKIFSAFVAAASASKG